MYLINKASNTIEKIEQKTFSSLGFKERDHLQKWIAHSPDCLGEELLIIQEEFSGFEDTRERLDLLALDKTGNIVVIENKLDDSGRDVTWQALKYASYCSTLTKEQIINIYQDYLNKTASDQSAKENLEEFFDTEDPELNVGNAQRLIFIAAEFRKEVTSTVLWLLNYGLRVQCFKVTPHQMGEYLLLNFDQIIPVKDAEELIIKMAQKQKEEISSQAAKNTLKTIRREFWTKLLHAMNEKSDLYQNISPSDYHWIGAGSGVRGIAWNFVVGTNFGRVEVYIDRGDREENKFCYDFLHEKKEKLENDFGGELIWQRLDDKQACRIKYEFEANLLDKATWGDMISRLVDGMLRMEKAIKPVLGKLGKELKKQ